MKRTAILVLVIAQILVAGAHAGLEKFALPAMSPTQQMNVPSLAVGPGGLTMVAYSTNDLLLMNFIEVQAILTRAPGWPVAMPDPVGLGAGYAPQICWSREGWICAFSSAGMLMIAESDPDGGWDSATQIIPIAGSITKIDLWGAPTAAAGPSAFAVVECWQDPPFGGNALYYLQRTSLGWSEPELVVPESPQTQRPQITYTNGPAGPWPQIYYLGEIAGERHLMTAYKDLVNGWSTPVSVPWDGVSGPTAFGGDFEVVRHWDGRTEILGLGPMPTCPCREILFQENDNGWQPFENVTAPVEAYDQAYGPAMVNDDLGKTYAFWTQEGSDPSLAPHSRTLHYRVREGGVWHDWDTLFADQTPLAPRHFVDIDVSSSGEPVMAWTRTDTIEGVPQPERVWIARINGPSSVPGGRAHEGAQLAAWPNPFNPRVKLSIEVTRAGPVRLDIHDARGRRVRTLLMATLSVDRHTVDWDGADATGREMPSGVYFARAVTADGAAVTKLVLAR